MILEREGRFNAHLLMEELLEAFPFLLEELEDGTFVTQLVFEHGDNFVRISHPELPREAEAVVDAHDPDGKSSRQQRTERFEALKAGIRVKLLGLGFTSEELQFVLDVLVEARRPVGQ